MRPLPALVRNDAPACELTWQKGLGSRHDNPGIVASGAGLQLGCRRQPVFNKSCRLRSEKRERYSSSARRLVLRGSNPRRGCSRHGQGRRARPDLPMAPVTACSVEESS